MKNIMKGTVKWVLRSSGVNVDLPASSFGFEVRRSMFIPMLDRKVRRLLYFGRMFDLIKNVEGDVVECGVLYGESLLLLSFLANDEGKKRKVWGFDSFEPLPPGTARDKTDTPRKLRHLSGTTVGTGAVEKLLNDSGLGPEFVASQVTLVRGYFEDTLSKFTGKAVALLHIDVDLYDSYKCALEELYPRVATGGVIMFDEYMGTGEHAYFPGAQRAIDEFLGERRSEIQRDSNTGKYYFVKDRKLDT